MRDMESERGSRCVTTEGRRSRVTNRSIVQTPVLVLYRTLKDGRWPVVWLSFEKLFLIFEEPGDIGVNPLYSYGNVLIDFRNYNNVRTVPNHCSWFSFLTGQSPVSYLGYGGTYDPPIPVSGNSPPSSLCDFSFVLYPSRGLYMNPPNSDWLSPTNTQWRTTRLRFSNDTDHDDEENERLYHSETRFMTRLWDILNSIHDNHRD